MGKKFTVDGLEVELDDDISLDDLSNHPAPENALSDDVIRQFQDDEAVLGE